MSSFQLHDWTIGDARALLAEYNRRHVDRTSLVLDRSTPYSDMLYARDADYLVYWGGRDSAKSWSAAETAIRLARQERIRVLCTRQYQTSIRDSIHKLLKDTIARMGATGFTVTDRSITHDNGSEFIFKGLYHNTEEIKSTEGIDLCLVEEGQYVSDESLDVLLPTIRKAGSRIIFLFNTTDEEAPIHRRFVLHPPPRTVVHKVNYDQNPFLSERSKRAIEHLRSADYEKYLHIYEGEPLVISDRIIFGGRYEVAEFAEDLWKQSEALRFGGDFGFANDPSTLLREFVIKEGSAETLYIEHEAGGTNIEFAGEMTEDGRGELEQMYDSVPGSRDWPIYADGSRPETISFLKGKGFRIAAADKWPGSVEDGIAHVKGFKRIVVHPRCKNTLQEMRTYSYKTDPKTGAVLPIIVDKCNHYMDAMRYGLDGYIQKRGGLGVWENL